MKTEKKVRKVPFFVRFLERQEKDDAYPKVKSNLRAGKLDQTMKAPSDKDEI